MKIYIFYCASALEIAEPLRSYSETRGEISVIPLPCSGKIDIPYLMKAFETGADGVAIVMCPQGECIFLEGNLRARRRAEAVDALLGESGLGKHRTAVFQIKDGDAKRIIHEIENFRTRLEARLVWIDKCAH